MFSTNNQGPSFSPSPALINVKAEALNEENNAPTVSMIAIIAVFDFSDLTDDWNNLLKGKYSKLTINVKRKISTYFQSNTANQVYINSYLYPKDYFEIYSELLQVDVTLLKEVGELCSKPDLEKEILYQTVQDLQLTKILD